MTSSDTATSTASQSLASLAELQDEIIALKRDYDSMKKELEERGRLLEERKSKLLAILVENKLSSFKTANGQIVVNRRFAVQTPKGEDLDLFLGHLEATRPDDYKALRGVNYQTLNAWYSQEFEAAKERGDFDFKIPGLGEPTANEYLTIRGK